MTNTAITARVARVEKSLAGSVNDLSQALTTYQDVRGSLIEIVRSSAVVLDSGEFPFRVTTKGDGNYYVYFPQGSVFVEDVNIPVAGEGKSYHAIPSDDEEAVFHRGVVYCRVTKTETGFYAYLTDDDSSLAGEGTFAFFKVAEINRDGTIVQNAAGAVYLDRYGVETTLLPWDCVTKDGITYLYTPKYAVVHDGKPIPVVNAQGDFVEAPVGKVWGWCEYGSDLKPRYVVAAGTLTMDVEHDDGSIETLQITPSTYICRKPLAIVWFGGAVPLARGTIVVTLADLPQAPMPYQVLTHTVFDEGGAPIPSIRLYTPPNHVIRMVELNAKSDGTYSTKITKRSIGNGSKFIEFNPTKTHWVVGADSADDSPCDFITAKSIRNEIASDVKFPVCGEYVTFKMSALLVFVDENFEEGKREDCANIYRFLHPMFVKHADNVVVLQHENATAARVTEELTKLIAESEFVCFYVCCHGGPGPTGQMMVMYDTFLTDREMWHIISKSEGKVWTIFDCCFGGSMYSDTKKFPDKEDEDSDDNGGDSGDRLFFSQRRVNELAAAEPPESYKFSLLSWSSSPENNYGYSLCDDAGVRIMSFFIQAWINAKRNLPEKSTYDSVWDYMQEYNSTTWGFDEKYFCRAVMGNGFYKRIIFG